MKHPSHKEIIKKIDQAKKAVACNKILFINQTALISVIYFKFAVVNEYFYLVSLHKHRPM